MVPFFIVVFIAVICATTMFSLQHKGVPKLLSLSTLVVFRSMVFWGWVLGPIGMIISVPMTRLVKIAFESYENTRRFGIMLGSGDEIE
jgi:AI-2 transport protein TqsA